VRFGALSAPVAVKFVVKFSMAFRSPMALVVVVTELAELLVPEIVVQRSKK
jgi:hypothetical protein